jgi:MtN3 and saliva related transmembrane protein
MPTPNTPPSVPRWFQWYMYLVGIGGNSFFYIQAIEIFTSQSAHDVSLAAFSIALWAVSSWFVYGVVLRNPVLIIANIVGIIGAAFVVTGKLLYG